MGTVICAVIIYFISRVIEPNLPDRLKMPWARTTVSMLIAAAILLAISLLIFHNRA